jgi:hypothetical protein
VVGIFGLMGLIALIMFSRSSQQNLMSHRTRFNIFARNMAESGLSLLCNAMVDSIHPNDSSLKSMVSGPNKNRSFFDYYIRNAVSMGMEGFIEHDDIEDMLPKRIKAILKNFAVKYNDMELEYRIGWVIEPGTPCLSDSVDKHVRLYLECHCHYRGVTKKATGSRRIKVYNLLPAVTSRFTFFHKNRVGTRYNRFHTDLSGRPIMNNSRLVYAESFPLILFNHNVASAHDGDMGDKNLYGPGGLGTSRQNIEKRGYLYLGDDANLALTPGNDPDFFTQYYHLFDMSNATLGKGLINYPVRVTDHPEPMEELYQVNNVHPNLPKLRETDGKVGIMSMFEGFYDTNSINEYISSYRPGSSLLHVFGTYQNPSRAYTVGNANQLIVRLSSMGLDRMDSSSDESNQRYCLGREVKEDDGTMAILRQYFGSLSSLDYSHPIREMMANENYCFSADEPTKISLKNPMGYQDWFEDIDSYQKVMSDIVKVPLNELVSYPHYSPLQIPLREISKRDQVIQMGEDSPHADGHEKWKFEYDGLHSQDECYVDGYPFSRGEPSRCEAQKNLQVINGLEGLERMGFLTRYGNYWVLNSRGQKLTVVMGLDEKFEVPGVLHVKDSTSLEVLSDCRLRGVEADSLFALKCSSITFDSSGSNSKTIYHGFYDSMGPAGKSQKLPEVQIIGGLSAAELSSTIFQSPTAISYDTRYNPTKKTASHYYRMALNDAIFDWRSEL